MKEKGISNFIATILLVAFAVAIGGLVSIWLTTTVTKSTGSIEVTNATLCAGSYISVDQVSSTSIIYSNPTQQTISGMTAIASDGQQPTLNTTSLNASQIASQSWTRGTNTSITLRGLCRATIPVEGKCESGQSCWK